MKIFGISAISTQAGVNKSDTARKINFYGTKNRAIPVLDGVFSEAVQTSLEKLHKNLKEIQDLFLDFAHYPAKAIAIKNGYPELLQKNRNQGLSFALPDKRGSIIIRQLRVDTNLLRFMVQDGNRTTSFLTDGYTKSVANINQSNPQFLPRKFRYMSKKEIEESGIEEYIKYTGEKIDKYNEYLQQFKNPEKKREVPVIRKSKSASSSQKTSKVKTISNNFSPSVFIKECAKSITKIFEQPVEGFPKYLKPELNKLNKIKSITVNLSDSRSLSVEKKVDSNYGSNLIYLKFSETLPDGTTKYLGVDLNTYKILRMRDNGKPYVKDDNVYEYDDAEVKKKNLIERLRFYREHFCKPSIDTPEQVKKESVAPEIKPIKNEKPVSERNTPVIEPIKTEKSDNKNEVSEKLKLETIAKAKEDADILADIYFKEFKEKFTQNIMKKFEEFKAEIEKLMSK